MGSDRKFWVAHIGGAMVGCVGAIVRGPADLAKGIPKDKEYLLDKENDEEYERVANVGMWEPLGVPSDAEPGSVSHGP